jgi:uncharacterized protein YjgD (DUF1641 family)
MSESNAQAGVALLAQAAQDSLTDTMVERLSTTGANALEVVDRLNDEDTFDAVMSLIDKLTDMHRSGSLDTLFETANLMHGARSALTDNMVERMFIFVEHMITNLANEDMADLAHNARRSMEEAGVDIAGRDVPKGGLLSTISMLSKPESQQALQFLLAFACKMKARTAGEHDQD